MNCCLVFWFLYVCQVYFVGKLQRDGCIRVRGGDRVGVFFKESPGAISYVFNGQDPQAFSTLANVSDPYPIGHVVPFDPLSFPYDFSVAAYVDTNLTKYNETGLTGNQIKCPEQLYIPAEIVVTMPPTPSTPPPTGAPGATGPTGPRGSTGSTGPEGATGPVGPEGATGATGPMGWNGTDGGEGPIGATGFTGPQGPSGGVGATGPRGERGPQGNPGPPGPTVSGPKDPNSIPVVDAEVDLMKEVIILVLLVWLIIVTLLLIVLVIITCYLWRRKRQEERRAQSYYADNINLGAARGRLTSNNPSEPDPQYAGMKEETESQYSLDTIERDGPGPGKASYVNAGADLSDNTGNSPPNGDLSKEELANY